MTQWTLYTRSGCSLCEAMIEELAEALGPVVSAAVSVVDIDSDPALVRKYSTRIPVLLADGEFVCCYRLDRERIAAHVPDAP